MLASQQTVLSTAFGYYGTNSHLQRCARPDKERFVGELARVCAPGGRIIIVTWCHRCAARCSQGASGTL